jgi:hypothetical protein
MIKQQSVDAERNAITVAMTMNVNYDYVKNVLKLLM